MARDALNLHTTKPPPPQQLGVTRRGSAPIALCWVAGFQKGGNLGPSVRFDAGRRNSDIVELFEHHKLHSERPFQSADTCTSGRTSTRFGSMGGVHLLSASDSRCSGEGERISAVQLRLFMCSSSSTFPCPSRCQMTYPKHVNH